VRGVLVLIILAVGLGLGLVVLAVLGYGLFGQVRRFGRAAAELEADARRAASLGEALAGEPTADARHGRHRAG
jgi:hypothetical protein